MANQLYLDSSALLKLYVAEAESVQLQDFVRQLAPPIPYSTLHELEIGRRLRQWRTEGVFDGRDATRTLRTIDQDLTAQTLYRPDANWPSIFSRAVSLVGQHSTLRSLDALHLAHALELQADVFITYDQRQRTVASKLRFRVFPRNPPSPSRATNH